MKKIYFGLCILLVAIVVALVISANNGNAVKKDGLTCKDSATNNSMSGELVSYVKNNNGTWRAEGKNYKSKITLKGKLPSSDKEVTYVVLTNDSNITFDEVAKSYYSSNSSEHLDSNVTCVVQMTIK